MNKQILFSQKTKNNKTASYLAASNEFFKRKIFFKTKKVFEKLFEKLFQKVIVKNHMR